MTFVPRPLADLQRYMHAETGLPFSSLGVYPDSRHDGGYHCGWDRRRIRNGVLSDYSWQESSRDWNHRTDAARAFDCGMFPLLRQMSIWIVGECDRGSKDTQDIRSIIYSPDGIRVLRWDRLGRHSGGDSSHLTHTHFSFFADAQDRDKTAVFKRFFEENEMFNQDDRNALGAMYNVLMAIHYGNTGSQSPTYPTTGMPELMNQVKEIEAKVDQILTQPPAPVDLAVVRRIIREEIDKSKWGSVTL